MRRNTRWRDDRRPRLRLRAATSALAFLMALAGGLPALAGPIEEAEELVRRVYFEGLPFEEVSALSRAQVVRLGEMLAEPGEAEHHGNIVLALGMSGHPAAFAPLRAFAKRVPQGEVDRATYRAYTRVPLAMGHLARKDARAMRWLKNRARRPAAEPAWTFRQHRGARLARTIEDQTLTGLALTGSPKALELLASAERDGDDRRAQHVRNVRNLHAEVASRGARAVFGKAAGKEGE